MVQIHSLYYRYNNGLSLSFPDWTIASGEKWLMLGESGSGKTTLLHLLSGLLKPTQGFIVMNDVSFDKLSGARLDHFRGKNIGLIFQRPHLIKSLTIAENLKLAQSLAGLVTQTARIDEVLESLGIADKRKSYPAQLSQGQLQRVSIARAVVNKPSLLIADEPTSSLDDKNAGAVLDLLVSQAEENQSTLIVATHDKRVKDRIAKAYMVN